MSFYTETSKQVHDIHEEARRIAEEEKNNSTAEGSQAAPSATTEKAPTIV